MVLLRFIHDFADILGSRFVKERFTNLSVKACRSLRYLDTLQSLLECERHSTTDDESIDFGDEIVDQLDLIRDFSTSKDGQEGTFGVLEGFGKVIEFFLHEESGGTLREVNTDHRRMSTVRSPEGVVYQLARRWERGY